MTRSACLTVSLLVIAGCTADEETTASLPDSRLIQGVWKVRSASSAGEPTAPEQFADVRFSIAHDKLTIRAGNDDPMTLHYTLDSSKTPNQIDTTHEIDPGEPIVQLGIYAIEEDTLKLSLAPADSPRPKTFADRRAASFVLERVEHTP